MSVSVWVGSAFCWFVAGLEGRAWLRVGGFSVLNCILICVMCGLLVSSPLKVHVCGVNREVYLASHGGAVGRCFGMM